MSSVVYYLPNQLSLIIFVVTRRRHSFSLTQKQSSYDDCNFVTGMLFYHIYWLNYFLASPRISLFHCAACHTWLLNEYMYIYVCMAFFIINSLPFTHVSARICSESGQSLGLSKRSWTVAAGWDYSVHIICNEPCSLTQHPTKPNGFELELFHPVAKFGVRVLMLCWCLADSPKLGFRARPD